MPSRLTQIRQKVIDRFERHLVPHRQLRTELAKFAEQLHAQQKAALWSMIRILELRDPDLLQHSQRTADLSLTFAQQSNLVGESLPSEWLYYGALLHDLGKVVTSDYLLHKQEALTKVERETVQYHPFFGAHIIEPFGLDHTVTDIIMCHHENFDGSGYPNGLVGENIPFSARIVKLTDAYDALTTKRSYKPAYAVSQTCEILQSERAFFDPHLLDAFTAFVSAAPKA